MRGSKVGGDVFFYWSKEERDEKGHVYWKLESRDSAQLAHQFEGRCDQFKASEEMQTCHAKFVTLPNWQDVLARLETHHVWTLPNMSTLRWHSARRFVVNDGYGMVVEVRDGDAYRSYEYDNPDSYITEWPEEAGDAVAIVRATRSIHSYIVPEKKQ